MLSSSFDRQEYFYYDDDVDIFEDSFLQPLTTFLRRNPSKQTCLHIFFADLEEDHTIELLQAAPLLTGLHLRLWRLTDNGLRHFTLGTHPALCLNLLSLELTISDASKISIKKMTDMIDSRLNENPKTSLVLDLGMSGDLKKRFSEDPEVQRIIQRLNESPRSKLKFHER